MGRAAAARKRHVENTDGPHEVVPDHVYAGFDFETFNAKVTEFRGATDVHGFDASLSKFVGAPTAVARPADPAS